MTRMSAPAEPGDARRGRGRARDAPRSAPSWPRRSRPAPATRSRRSTPARWSWPRATASCARRCSGSSTSCPACRSLDDLARHLTGFLDEVPDAPAAALRGDADRATRKAGRAALGAAAAGGVRHMAHRFIVGETPGGRARRCCAGCGTAAWPARSTCSARRPSPQAEADRYATRCAEALEQLAPAAARLARARPMLERDSVGPLPRANVSVKVSALTPLLRPDAPELGQRDAAAPPAAAAAPRRTSSAPTCTSTWSRSTRARRCSSWCSSCSPRRSSATGPSAGLVLQAYLRDSPEQLDAGPRVGAAPRSARRR